MNESVVLQSSFDLFMAFLDRDEERAGRKYELLRTRLVKFFEWRTCRFPEDLADETLDRLINKVAQGVEIGDHVRYSYGIARLVLLENWKNETDEVEFVEDSVIDVSEVVDDRDDSRMSCLEQCLEQLSENSRSMILQYYRDDKQAKIDHRKALAERFNISLNALRIKTLRIRTKLEECVLKCVERVTA